jgi:hypothetical protein
MSLRRFTSVKNLRGLGRPLLKIFFGKFETELKKSGVKLPAENLDDDPYFKQLSKFFLSPKQLPKEMTEVLYAVLELADDEGAADLSDAAKAAELPIDLTKPHTNLDIVMQVWLEDPKLMMQHHNEHKLLRTTTFQYWGTKIPVKDRFPFKEPTDAEVKLIEKAVDDWCVENQRGEDTASITKHQLDGEWWFLIQHGGTMSRLAEAEGNHKTGTIFYRPGKDDVVVYNVERDELRIHAGTKRERTLYRTEFGRRLRSETNFFSERKNFVLDPLRSDVGKALSVEGLPDIKRIVLQELEISFFSDFGDRTIRKSDDIVASAAQRSKEGKVIPPVPLEGKLVRAVFEMEFENSTKPRRVQVKPPDGLSVGRHGDTKAVQDWLTLREFRATNGDE